MMKRAFLLSFPIFLSLLLFSFTHKNEEPPKATIKTLIIDPGHGGSFAGTRGSFSSEEDVSLEVALKYGKALQKEFPDLKIVFTRTTDANAGGKKSLNDDLRYRADLANSSNGDLFISIHCNAGGKRAGGWYENVVVGRTPYKKTVGKGKKKKTITAYRNITEKVWRENNIKGTETYIWAVDRSDAKANSIHNTEYYGEIDSTSSLELPDPSDPVEKARMQLYAQNFFKKSLNLADMVEKEFEAAGRVSRGVKQRNDKGIRVLQATGMPSILVEIGFLSNTEEEKYLNSESGQAEIVQNLVNAFKAYKQKVESKGVSGTP